MKCKCLEIRETGKKNGSGKTLPRSWADRLAFMIKPKI